MAAELGEGLAKSAPTPLEWLEPIVQAVLGESASERNYDLLSGFVAGLPAVYHGEVEAFQKRAVESPDLAPAFTRICRRGGLTPPDINRAIDALGRGTLSPWGLRHWSYVEVLYKVPSAEVACLLDAMLDHSAPSFALAVTILGQIIRDEGDRPDRPVSDGDGHTEFRSKFLKMAQNAGRWSRAESSPPPGLEGTENIHDVAEYWFEEIVLKMLEGGRKDSEARKTALALARAVAHGDHDAWINPSLTKPSPVLTKLLKGFPEIAWPLIGGAIVADSRFASRMRYVLGRPYAFGRNIRPPILDLPVDTLFAWCHAHPDGAPAFLAQCVPILSKKDDTTDIDRLHPIMSRLLDEFGERGDVQQAIESNLHTYGWSGSSATHYSRYREPLERLCSHRNSRVRQWAEKMGREVGSSIAHETTRERERVALRSWP